MITASEIWYSVYMGVLIYYVSYRMPFSLEIIESFVQFSYGNKMDPPYLNENTSKRSEVL
jgi:hypothetical protein